MKRVDKLEVDGIEGYVFDASVDFESKPISMTESGPWSIDCQFEAGASLTGAVLDVYASNQEDGEYKLINGSIDITTTSGQLVISGYSPYRYVQIAYTAGTSTGSFSVFIAQS